MTLYLISDVHLQHPYVANLRGFDTSDEHDEHVLRQATKKIRDTDTVWWLGDLSMGDRWAGLQRIMIRVPGNHHLVLGNHDRGHPSNSNGHSYLARYLRIGFDSVQTSAKIRYNGIEMLLSHFPYEGDSGITDRLTQWRLRDEGDILLHGHTHSGAVISYTTKNTPQLHVGLDAWDFKPAHIHEVLENL